MLNIYFFSIKYLRVILAHVKMEVNVQMLEILSTVNVLLVIEEKGVRMKVWKKYQYCEVIYIILYAVVICNNDIFL